MKPLVALPHTVAEIMSRNPIRMRPDDRLDIALALMVSCRFRHLNVMAGGQLVGIVSLRDLYAADLSHPASTRAQRALHLRTIEARQVMSSPVTTVDAGESHWSAAQTMIGRSISCLPVVDHQRIVCMLTRTDFLRAAIDLLEREPSRGAPTPVSAIMTPTPIASVRPDDHLDLARSLMAVHHIRHLPVVVADRVVAILSDHDLLRGETSDLSPRNPRERLEERSHLEVRDVMTEHVATVDSRDGAFDAARLLLKRRFGALPVLSSGRLVGMLSVTDLFYHLLSYSPTDQLRAAQR